MFERSTAGATDVLSRLLQKPSAVLASFDDEILLCECANGVITCDGPAAEREAP